MSGTPLSAGLANWHWRQKQVDKWAYDWVRSSRSLSAHFLSRAITLSSQLLSSERSRP
jgi:activator of HSP90 ATPase